MMMDLGLKTREAISATNQGSTTSPAQEAAIRARAGQDRARRQAGGDHTVAAWNSMCPHLQFAYFTNISQMSPR